MQTNYLKIQEKKSAITSYRQYLWCRSSRYVIDKQISLISYLPKKGQEKKSCNKSLKLHFYYSAQKYDDSILLYFPFSKRQFPQKIECCVYIMIMIVIIAIIYIFFYCLRYLINSWKLLSESPQQPPPPSPWKKSTTLPPPKNSKSASPPLFGNIQNFSGLLSRKGGEGTMNGSMTKVRKKMI